MSEGIYREIQKHDDEDFYYKDIIYVSFTQADEYHIEEKLPLSCVHTGKYFNGYQFAGYYAFSDTPDSDVYFCECQKQAIKNHLDICDLFEDLMDDRYNELLHNYIMSLKFPSIINKLIIDSKCTSGKEIFPLLKFKNSLCHLCNNVTPTMDWTGYANTSGFEKKFGQYLKARLYDWGIGDGYENVGIYFIKDAMPDDIKSILIPSLDDLYSDIISYYHLSEKRKEKVKKELDSIGDIPEPQRMAILYNQYKYKDLNNKTKGYFYRLNREYPINSTVKKYISKILWIRYLEVKRIAADEIKRAFKVKRWVNESILINYISEIFNDKTIYTHYRPSILDGLELDIFIKELNVGIEYQGIQHVKSIKAWGGEEGLKNRKEHDEKKARLCKKNNIDLIYFWYDEDLTKDLIRDKLSKYIN